MTTDPLASLDPLNRFSNRAEDYVRYRPDYPAAALDCILDGLAPPASLVAADIGAGTGISARQLADRGVRVIAVEPNAAMRAAAAPHARIEWREGSAEATGLADASVDVVLCAQAYHWFRAEPAIAEFHRVLKPGGRLAVMWNMRDSNDPLTHDYFEAIHAVIGVSPAEQLDADLEAAGRSGLFTPLVLSTFTHAQRLDLPGLIGRAASASYVPKEPEPFARLKALLATAFERHREPDGLVTMRYGTEVWRAAKV